MDRGLFECDFKCVAGNGFGDALNSYAHSVAWFDGHLYVGTSRATLAMVRANQPPPSINHWPVRMPKSVYDLDRRAQIWRYSPESGRWQQVYASPMVKGSDGLALARDIGYRGMATFRGTTDARPALYVCTWSSSKGPAPTIMRSEDGITFHRVPCPDWGGGINTFRTLVPLNGRLFTAPTGRTEGYGQARECVSNLPVVFETSDPVAGQWKRASDPGFGDPDNVTVFELAAFRGLLYAGTINPKNGFQIWKAQVDGSPPYRWTKVVTDGAYRGNLNEIAVSMCAFGDALYVGSGIINGGYDRVRGIGPAAAEIIRIRPNDEWDLVVGTPRWTPLGMKLPMSGLGPGFDTPFNGYVWRMTQYNEWLYGGTFNWTVLAPFLSREKWPADLRSLMEGSGIMHRASPIGGFDLWRSRDGVQWLPVTRSGFRNPYNWGVRSMVSTPHGLFVGTANPFGPEVSVGRPGDGVYRANPRGGTEIWHGR